MRIFLILAVVAMLGLTTVQVFMTQDAAQSPATDMPDMGSADIGGTFSLTNQDGKQFSSEQLKGKVQLIFFGFTHCPDICPVTVSSLSKMMELLGDKADKVAPVFITVDPQRDSPETMKAYLAPFDKRIVGLTGKQDDIEQVLRSFKAYAARADVPAEEGHGDHGDHGDHGEGHAGHGEDDEDAHEAHQHGGSTNYTVDHSSYVYVMNQKGEFQKIFSYNTPEQELARAVEALLKE